MQRISGFVDFTAGQGGRPNEFVLCAETVIDRLEHGPSVASPGASLRAARRGARIIRPRVAECDFLLRRAARRDKSEPRYLFDLT